MEHGLRHLTIDVEYLQGKNDWDQRPVKVTVNGEEVQHHVAVTALLKCMQPSADLLKKREGLNG